jgi:hypothetical protein
MTALIAGFKRGWRCEIGAEFVEFALTFPLLRSRSWASSISA